MINNVINVYILIPLLQISNKSARFAKVPHQPMYCNTKNGVVEQKEAIARFFLFLCFA